MDLVQSAPTGPEDRSQYSVSIINPRNMLNPFQRKVKLPVDKKGSLEKTFEEQVKDWESGTALLRSKIQRWVNNSEGITDPRTNENSIWPNSSKIFKPLTETRLNIVHSYFMNVVRQRYGRLFQCVYEDKWDKDKMRLCQDITHFFNSNYEFNIMYIQGIDEAFWSVCRDGTVGRTAYWEKKVEHRWEVVKYTDIKQFLLKFPDPVAMGVDQAVFQQVVASLQINKPVYLDEDFDDVVFDNPVIGFTEIKDCVWLPVNAHTQDQMFFLGNVEWMRASQLKQLQEDGVFDGVDEIIKEKPVEQQDVVESQQDSIEGIQPADRKNFYKLVHGRYMADLDGDGIEEKYLVTYAVEAKKFIQFDRYPFFHNRDYMQITGFKKRVKRLLYRGISEMLEDLQEETNISARQRIDSRAITNAPMFKAVDSLKTALNPDRPENRFRPGGIWWLPQMFYDKVGAIEVEKKDFGESINEEANFDRTADNIIGASELRSGRETPLDPRAPAAKTAMLLSQSASRLDDFIYNFILGENRILDIILRLFAQYGPDKLAFYSEQIEQLDGKLQPGYSKQEIDSSLLKDPKFHLQLSFSSIMDNPEYLKAVWEEFYAKYNQEPLLLAIPDTRHKVLEQIILNTPEATGKNLLPPLQMILGKLPMGMDGQPTVLPPQGPGAPSAPGGAPPIHPTLLNAMNGKPPVAQPTIGR